MKDIRRKSTFAAFSYVPVALNLPMPLSSKYVVLFETDVCTY